MIALKKLFVAVGLLAGAWMLLEQWLNFRARSSHQAILEEFAGYARSEG